MSISGDISPAKTYFLEPRGAQGHKGRWESEIRTQQKGHPVWVPPRAGPAQPQPLCPGIKPTQRSQHQSTFGTEVGCCLGAWDIFRHVRQEHLGIAQVLCGQTQDIRIIESQNDKGWKRP